MIWWEARARERSFKGASDLHAALGLQPFRQRQIYRAATKELHADPGTISVLPRELRERLATDLPLASIGLATQETSRDGQTTKFLFDLRGGNQVEAVLMRHRAGRTTACISSQAGCALRCDFCATGQGGFSRNLSAVEIFDQVVFLARHTRAEERALTNVVFMGMGEPFLNYDAVMDAVALLNDPQGFGLGARRMTISTAGVVPGIERFTSEDIQVNLAISLHAADDELRTRLMPINKKWPIAKLMTAVQAYVTRTRRKVFYEYLMLADVNDRPDDARRLADLLGGPLHHVNLIPYNATDAAYQRSALPRIRRFSELLQERGVPTTIRHTMGDDIAAACGQLRIDQQKASA
ncbi:MAG TPA: 23S rRNA (adenine(2503)-C(2))-methyltransferase RlmN [Candidatus Acidoferrales bacterium]|nr:23S rRNA (adenine(2503)-C(2))-methyltransferase RlmN [Candidatus Acidoferrales bacterium]